MTDLNCSLNCSSAFRSTRKSVSVSLVSAGIGFWVSLTLDLLASRASIEELIENYPDIDDADVHACIGYGAEMTSERFVEIPMKGTQ